MLWNRTSEQGQDSQWRWVSWSLLASSTSIHHSARLQDAYVLGRLLTHKLTHLGNVGDALKVYEQVRLPFANMVVKQSRDVGRYYGFSVSAGSSGPARGTPKDLDYLQRSIKDAWAWQSESGWAWGEAEKRWLTRCGAHSKL